MIDHLVQSFSCSIESSSESLGLLLPGDWWEF